MMIRKFSLLFLAATILLSCSKDNDGPTRLDLISRQSWKVDERTVNGIIQDLDACDADNEWVFDRTGKLSVKAGAKTCSVEPAVIDGTWKFVNEEKAIEIEEGGTGTKNTLSILELTANSFTISSGGSTIRFEHFDTSK